MLPPKFNNESTGCRSVGLSDHYHYHLTPVTPPPATPSPFHSPPLGPTSQPHTNDSFSLLTSPPPPPLHHRRHSLILKNATLLPYCTTTFSCGSFTNITYPFICGPPDFQLVCRDNHPELTTNSLTYRLLHLNQTEQTLILARLDLWNQTWPKVFVSTTLNSTIFSPADGNNKNLTLFYGCNTSLMTLHPHNRFNCSINSINSTDSYYLIGPVPTDPTLHIIECINGVALPMLSSTVDELLSSRTSLAEALMLGFSVNYDDPYRRECSKCTEGVGSAGSTPRRANQFAFAAIGFVFRQVLECFAHVYC